jgi:hypothetical protein
MLANLACEVQLWPKLSLYKGGQRVLLVRKSIPGGPWLSIVRAIS